jgi:hypothetical protein
VQDTRIAPRWYTSGVSNHASAIEPTSGIREYLTRLRYQRLAVETLRSASLVAALLAIALLVLLLAAPLIPHWSTVRTTAWALAASAGLALAARIAFSAVRLRNEVALARLVGRRFPNLHSDLLSTVELLREPSPHFSPTLFAALARDTWNRLVQQHRSASGETLRLLRPGVLALCVAAVAWTGMALWKGPRLLNAALIVLGLEREAPMTATERIIRDLSLSYDYPAYMQRPRRTVEGSTGDITAPPGTRVQLRASTTYPARKAAIVLDRSGEEERDPSRRLALQLSERGALRGAITIETAAHYHFELVDRDGRSVRDPLQQRIDLEPDMSPKVLLRGPPDYSDVGELQQIELAYSAEDDWGLAAVELCWQHNGSPKECRQLWKPDGTTKANRRVANRFFWKLERLDLTAGGRVAYWIAATDNDAVSGPKRTRSRVRYLSVFSAEQRHAHTLARHRQLLEASLQLLSDRLLIQQSAPPAPKLRLARAKALHALHARQARFLDSVRDLHNQMDSDPLISEATLRPLSLMERRLNRLVNREKRTLGKISQLTAKRSRPKRRRTVTTRTLAALTKINTRAVDEMERDALLIANLLDEQRLQSVEQAAQRLKNARAHLDQLLERYRESRDPQLKREILREIARMKQQLARMAAKMDQLSGTVADEYLNAEAVKRLDVGADLDQLERLVQNGSIDELAKALESLDDKLARMESLLESNMGDYRNERLTERERAYGKLLDKLHELESGQRALAKQTAKLKRRYRERGSQMMRRSIEPRLREQLPKVELLERQIEEVRKRPLEPYHDEQLQRSSRWARWLEDAIKQNDLPQSLDMVRRLSDQLKQLGDEMQEDTIGMFVPWRRRQQKTLEGIARAQGTANEIEEALDQLFPSPDKLLDAKERAQMRQLRMQQKRLRQRLAKLLEERQPEGSAAGQLLGPKQRSKVDEAGRLMQEASKRLGRLRPQRAEAAQNEAVAQLSGLRQDLKRARSPRGSGGGKSQRDRVEIPDAEAFEAPRAFREDLLEAMKEPPPQGYEPLVEQYYRELIR